MDGRCQLWAFAAPPGDEIGGQWLMGGDVNEDDGGGALGELRAGNDAHGRAKAGWQARSGAASRPSICTKIPKMAWIAGV